MSRGTSEKTILSDLEAEDVCNVGQPFRGQEHFLDGEGKNSSDEDSSIFKSFFASEGGSQQSHKQATTLSMQSCDSKNNDGLDKDLTGCEKVSVKTNSIGRIDFNAIPTISESTQCENRIFTDKMNTYKSTGMSDFISVEKENAHVLGSTKSNESMANNGLLACVETDSPKDSNSLSSGNTFLYTEKIGTVNQGSRGDNESSNSFMSKDDLLTESSSECCEKENSAERKDEKASIICTEKTHESGASSITEGENIPASMDVTCARKPMFEKVVNATNSTCDSKKSDPFTLSGDEDFSPKAYKPIKRKLNQGLTNWKACGMDTLDSSASETSNDEKKQKLIEEEDLTLSDMSRHKPVSVAYVHSKELVDKANRLIRIEGRAELVHSLIEVYGILHHVEVVPPRLATETEITGFHCSEYIGFLKVLKDSEDMSESSSAEAEAYGLSYDCPVQDNVFETASLISGATISAAETLINGTASIAINWCGGWHHAKRDSASGFCYMNDIVLGILKLREKFERVLYVDLDLHHGDGVEEAFYMTPKVMTVSFHKYACGFFPGSGSVADTGTGRGRLHTINIPLMDGIGDRQFFSIFTSVMKKVRDKFHAEAVVIQCGADTLSEDPMASFNLTHVAIAKCVCFLLTWSLPTLLLGGGGYNFPNTAKCWTFLTAMAAGKKLPVDIPEHEHLMEYGPSFELTTSQGNRKDSNTKEHFNDVMTKISKNLNCLS